MVTVCVSDCSGTFVFLFTSYRDLSIYSGVFVFFFNVTATAEIYTLSLHDALPISWTSRACWRPPTAISFLTVLPRADRKSTRLNSSHVEISYAVFCLKKKKKSLLPATRRYCAREAPSSALSRSRPHRTRASPIYAF